MRTWRGLPRTGTVVRLVLALTFQASAAVGVNRFDDVGQHAPDERSASSTGVNVLMTVSVPRRRSRRSAVTPAAPVAPRLSSRIDSGHDRLKRSGDTAT